MTPGPVKDSFSSIACSAKSQSNAMWIVEHVYGTRIIPIRKILRCVVVFWFVTVVQDVRYKPIVYWLKLFIVLPTRYKVVSISIV
jgi:hypothetical protein